MAMIILSMKNSLEICPTMHRSVVSNLMNWMESTKLEIFSSGSEIASKSIRSVLQAIPPEASDAFSPQEIIPEINKSNKKNLIIIYFSKNKY